MFKLIELAYGLVISKKEWTSGLLSKETMKRFGVKSPKLSKLLKHRGVPDFLIQKVLPSGEESYFSSAWEQQGDSIHFSSCQARDRRAKWFVNREESLWEPGDSDSAGMRMWVAGKPMSEDGKGFKARAKVRFCYGSANKLVGVFVDKIYGQAELLKDEDLKVLLLKEFGPVEILTEPRGRLRGEKVWIPSVAKGYQDSFHSQEAVLRKKKDELGEALLDRLSVPIWLRQSYKDWLEGVSPPPIRRWRGDLRLANRFKKAFGLPKEARIVPFMEGYRVGKYTYSCNSEKTWTLKSFHRGLIAARVPEGIIVSNNDPSLGFCVADDI